MHPFRNSFGLIDLCRLSRDTRLTSDSCSSGWSFVIGFLHQGRCLPRLARFTRPSPVRADSGLSPHRHTCAAGRNRIGGMGLLSMPSFHTTVRTDPYTAVPSNRLNSQSDAIPRAEQSEQARSILFVSGTRLSRSRKAPDSRPPSNSFYSSLRPSSPSLWTLPVS